MSLLLEIVLKRELIIPAFKQQASRVETLLTNQSPWKIKKSIETHGKYTVGLEGRYLNITPDMVSINISKPESVTAKDFDFGTIYIECELTQEPMSEGMSRDIIEHINNIREELSINNDEYLDTKIYVEDGVPEPLAGCTELIKQQTKSYIVEFAQENFYEGEDCGYNITELEVDGLTILIGIAIIEWEW